MWRKGGHSQIDKWRQGEGESHKPKENSSAMTFASKSGFTYEPTTEEQADAESNDAYRSLSETDLLYGALQAAIEMYII